MGIHCGLAAEITVRAGNNVQCVHCGNPITIHARLHVASCWDCAYFFACEQVALSNFTIANYRVVWMSLSRLLVDPEMGTGARLYISFLMTPGLVHSSNVEHIKKDLLAR